MSSSEDRRRRADERWMRRALALARRGLGATAPNPAVGAVLVRNGRVLGEGFHTRAGAPHAEVEAFHDARRRARDPRGATLYVTLEPCSTAGRTPPCTAAIVDSGIRRLVAGAADPNPAHAGRGFRILEAAGIEVCAGVCADRCAAMNRAFDHWIVERTPYVTLKAAMTLDGKIATPDGESRWITSPRARGLGMDLRRVADAVLVGVGTVIQDDPALTWRHARPSRNPGLMNRKRWRVILDPKCRTPLDAQVVRDGFAESTVIVTTAAAPRRRRDQLEKRVAVWGAPARAGSIDLRWLLRRLGRIEVTHLLVEGGGTALGAFVDARLANEVVIIYAPKVLGGAHSVRAFGGHGAHSAAELLDLKHCRWRRLGDELVLCARVGGANRLD